MQSLIYEVERCNEAYKCKVQFTKNLFNEMRKRINNPSE